MRRFVASLWNKIQPGVSVAMMGLLAALYPILATELVPPREKALWIAGFFTLMCIEMFIIFRERARLDQSFLDQIAKLDGIRSAYDAHSVALERVRNSVRNDSLRYRASRLSESILDFGYERLKNQPRWGRGAEALGAGMDVLSAYHNETIAIYKNKFSWAALGVIGDLEKLDLADDVLRTSASAPRNPDEIQFIGQRIGELVEDIKG